MQKRRLDCIAPVGFLTANIQQSHTNYTGGFRNGPCKALSRGLQPRAIEEVRITYRSEGTMGNRDIGIQRVAYKEA